MRISLNGEVYLERAKKERRKHNDIVVAVSGGFDPLHYGHIQLIQSAKKLGDRLVVIINNDEFLIRKKGFYFMTARERARIVNEVKGVDEVFISNDKDDTVCEALRDIHPDIFANGGDRGESNSSRAEEVVCSEIYCAQRFGIGGYYKLDSSSNIVSNFLKRFLETDINAGNGMA